MTDTSKIEAVLTVQHHKQMYAVGTASVDQSALKKIGIVIPDGMDLNEVIAVHFTFKTKE